MKLLYASVFDEMETKHLLCVISSLQFSVLAMKDDTAAFTHEGLPHSGDKFENIDRAIFDSIFCEESEDLCMAIGRSVLKWSLFSWNWMQSDYPLKCYVPPLFGISSSKIKEKEVSLDNISFAGEKGKSEPTHLNIFEVAQQLVLSFSFVIDWKAGNHLLWRFPGHQWEYLQFGNCDGMQLAKLVWE